MLKVVNFFICVFFVVWTVVTSQLTDFYEGDICKEENGTDWTCLPLKDCLKSKEVTSEDTKLQYCGSTGDPVVCCEPDEILSEPQGAKSKQACKKYSEAVYAFLSGSNNDGNTFLLDTCTDAYIGAFIGREAFPREFPHLALVGFGRKESVEWLCGGSLISEQFVLSTSLCTTTSKGLASWVRLGEYNKHTSIDDDQDYAKPMDYAILERINHPDYASPGAYNNIALYKLAEKVQFSLFTRPACLHTQHVFPKTSAIAVGWGHNGRERQDYKVPQKAIHTIVPRKVCSDSYAKELDTRFKNGIKDASMLCAGHPKSTKDSCQTGPGGALQLRMKDPYCMYSLLGVLSHCSSGKFGVYTRVSHFIPWIESVVWPNDIYNGSYIIGG